MSKELNLKNALLEIYRNPRLYKSKRRTPEKLKRSYQIAVDKLNLSLLQVELIATYFGKTSKHKCSLEEICNYIGIQNDCEAKKAHEELIQKKIIEESKIDNAKEGNHASKVVYQLRMNYVDIILENGYSNKDKELAPIYKLVKEINLIEEKSFKTLDIFSRKFYKILSRYRNLEFIEALKNEEFTFIQLWFLLRVVNKILDSNDNDFKITIIDELKKFEWGVRMIDKNKFLSDPENTLVTKGFIKLKQNENLPVLCYAKLGDRALELLKNDGVMFLEHEETSEEEIDLNDNKFTSIIRHNQINKIPLFHNKEEQEQIDLFKRCLEEDKLEKLKRHLSIKGISTGICSIFYGGPGTGKTETVFQLAKQLKRNVIQVNIAVCKSQWFGQSQKNIKAIFDDYKKKSKLEKCPILLLNEADALMSTRSELDLTGHNTENAIQNVFLEELENFEGILIATTNLAQNLDNAFERRFLFKIRFNQPEKDCAIRIWQNNIDFLSYDEAKELVNNFNFSGGQIRNIAKKMMIEEVLSSKITYQKIVEFSLQEKFDYNIKNVGIGFKQ